MANAINFVWNYCNDVNQERWKKFRKTFTAYDLHKMVSGCSNELGLNSQSINLICTEFDKCRRKTKKIKLAWRSKKRNLGWIPFKGVSVKITEDTIRYNGIVFKFWNSRNIEGKILTGSFSQDSKGHWYVNLTADTPVIKSDIIVSRVGIDLGLKTIASLSNGIELSRENITIKHEQRLAMAQRANKKSLVKSIHTKIKNQRKDWNHKATTQLVRNYSFIAIGNVSSSKLKKTRMAKSVVDAGWSTFKTMLTYKAIALGVEVKEVNESFSTVTCSSCSKKTGPSGLSKLGVRQWICSSCGVQHDRDANAAKNILLTAQGIERRLRESN